MTSETVLKFDDVFTRCVDPGTFYISGSSSRSRNNLNTHPPTQDREKDSEFEWNDQESGGSVWIDPRVSWCGDRDGDTNSQCTPALHYTGYIVQTVCQY